MVSKSYRIHLFQAPRFPQKSDSTSLLFLRPAYPLSSWQNWDEDIKKRDYNDSHRKVAPLKKADDAVELETTTMSIDEVVAEVIKIVKEKIQ